MATASKKLLSEDSTQNLISESSSSYLYSETSSTEFTGGKYPYLKDSDFLKLADQERLKTQYVKITFLNWDEKPIQEVQALTTGGTLSVDGKSSMRQTCSLSITIPSDEYSNVTDTTNLFSINKKVNLEIGFKNTLNKYLDYDILWFPRGVFVISSCSVSHSSSGVTASLQLKDKMCLLNGECGGTIPASTQFDSYDTIDENGAIVVEQPCVEQIIREAVNHFGGIELSKIIIEDVPNRIKTVMRWIGSDPVYLANSGDDSYQFTTDYDEAVSLDQDGNPTQYTYGEDIGYIYSDLVYTSDLIANAGDNVCTILDKIQSYLGNYEYFFDVFGNFRFREKKNYLNTTVATAALEDIQQSDYLVDLSAEGVAYDFSDTSLIISYNNNPSFSNVKNDFVIWGIRESIDGYQVPIRYHLALDNKPKTGNIYRVLYYEDEDDGLLKMKSPIQRESKEAMEKYTGVEGEIYITLDDEKIYTWDPETHLLDDGTYEEPQYREQTDLTLEYFQTTDYRSELYLQGVSADPLGLDSNYYYTELEAEWPKLYDFKASSYTDSNGNTIWTGDFKADVKANPSNIDYYLEIIDTNSKLSQLNVDNIGRRSYVKSDNDINCIFEPVIPDLVIIESGQDDTSKLRDECIKKGQKYVQVDSSIYEAIATGGLSNGAYEAIKDALYQYTSYNESVSITSLPIYHLEPNTIIKLLDSASNVSGNYLISSMSLPLAYNGNMTIQATRNLEKI